MNPYKNLAYLAMWTIRQAISDQQKYGGYVANYNLKMKLIELEEKLEDIETPSREQALGEPSINTEAENRMLGRAGVLEQEPIENNMNMKIYGE